MMTILNLFGRSPFSPLQSHMDTVAKCIGKLENLFEAFEKKNPELLATIAQEISELEHQADLIKNDIRNHLPKSLFLPIDHSQLLEILTLQDAIADAAEDVAVLFSLNPLNPEEPFYPEVVEFMRKNIETFVLSYGIIKELHELLESSFGGSEANKVKGMVDQVGYQEHLADLIQRKLLKHIFLSEQKMSYANFYLWLKIVEALGEISNVSEKLAYRIRMTLEIKSS